MPVSTINSVPTAKVTVVITIDGQASVTATGQLVDNMTSEGTGSTASDVARQITAIAANAAHYAADAHKRF